MIEVTKRKIGNQFIYFDVQGIGPRIVTVGYDQKHSKSCLYYIHRREGAEPSSLLEVLIVTGVTEEEIKKYAEANPQKDI